jgi:hypothetical protein
LFKNLAATISSKKTQRITMTDLPSSVPPAPPPVPPIESKSPSDNSLNETVLLSPASSTPDNKKSSLIRLEFSTRKKGKDINTEAFPKLVTKLVTAIYAADPTLEIHPIKEWPTEYTAVPSTVKTAPNTEEKNANNKNKTNEKQNKNNTITTPETLPTDRVGMDDYFEYSPDEHHPDESKKIVVRFYSTASKTVTELRTAVTTEFLTENGMWFLETRFETLRESTIGWILKVHPTTTNRDHYTSQLHAFLTEHCTAPINDDANFTPVTKKKRMDENSTATTKVTTAKCPPFRLLSKSTGYNRPTKDDKKGEWISTDVLQIRCATVDSERLQNILSSACDKAIITDQFIPYSLRKTNITGYMSVIQAQKDFLSNAVIFRVEGFAEGGLDLPFKDGSNETLRSNISNTCLFYRVDETISSHRSEGRALFQTDQARRAKAEEFLDITLPDFMENLSWEEKAIVLLPGASTTTRVANRRIQSDTVSSYVKNLVDKLPPYDFTTAPTPSTTNVWKKKRNSIIHFQDKRPDTFKKPRSPPSNTTTTSDTSVSESINTVPTLATQLSQTEALMDAKLAKFKEDMEAKINHAMEKGFADIVTAFGKMVQQSKAPPQTDTVDEMKVDLASLKNDVRQMTQLLKQQHYSHAPMSPSNRHTDHVSVHSQSVHSQSPHQGFPPQPQHYYGQQHQQYHYQQYPSNDSHQNYTTHPPLMFPDNETHANRLAPHEAFGDLSMADPNTTTNDLSMINRTMTDQNTDLPADQLLGGQSPILAPTGIQKSTSDNTQSGGVSK